MSTYLIVTDKMSIFSFCRDYCFNHVWSSLDGTISATEHSNLFRFTYSPVGFLIDTNPCHGRNTHNAELNYIKQINQQNMCVDRECRFVEKRATGLCQQCDTLDYHALFIIIILIQRQHRVLTKDPEHSGEVNEVQEFYYWGRIRKNTCTSPLN